MPIYRHRSELPVSAPEAFAWYERGGALERLAPPWLGLRVLERTPPAEGSSLLAPGARVRVSLRGGPLRLRWEAQHGAWEPGRSFTDAQLRGPFAHWVHAHRFIPRGDFACLLEDELDWRLPLGPLGWPALPWVRAALERAFAWRHARTAHDLARHARYAGRGALTVAVSGASGLVGARLCAFLSAGGHTVRPLVRAPLRPGGPGAARAGAIPWDPATGRLDPAALEGVDAVVHLAGANLAERRWSAARKRVLWDSRVESTALLARALAGRRRPPRVLVSASAIGIYGDAGNAPVDEDAPAGSGFLAELCAAWEAAAEPARQAGIRVVHPRLGLVLAGEGGVLAKLALPFALGLGGPLGHGRQGMSWIALEDLLSVLHAALFEADWSGPLNAVAPRAATNAEFTRALARVLRRPAFFRVPAWGIRLALGELGREALLSGQRVVPARLQAAGFAWRQPELHAALAEELGRDVPHPPSTGDARG
jgi:hypothetical protein